MTTGAIYRTPAGEAAIRAFYDRMVANWPAPARQMTLPTRHGNTFCLAWGDESKPSLVLLHGAASNSAVWQGAANLFGQHFHVYAVDLIGEAGRSAPNRPAWDGPAFEEWMEDVFNALSLHKAILAGVSQGGWTALKFATNHPQRVERLALISPGGVTPNRTSFMLRLIFYFMLGNWGMERIGRMFTGDQKLPEDVEAYMRLNREQFIGRVGVLPVFSDAELRRLEMPTLLLMGERDPLFDTKKAGRRLAANLPRFEALILPHEGHLILDLASRIMPFLTENSHGACT